MATKLFAGKETMAEEMAEAQAVKSGKLTPRQFAKREMVEEKKEDKMACGGKVKKMSGGGMARGGGAATKGKRFIGTF
jgi:hypothetical protein